jgi:hypothetical protein
MSRVLLFSVLSCCLGTAQTTKIDLQNQSRGVDFSAAPYTKPVKTGSALPPTCSTGEAYLLTTAVPGANFFVCTATNTWSLQGAGGATDHSQLTHLDYSSSGHTGFQPALGYTPMNPATLGLPNGPAKLGSDGKVLASELPAATSGLAVAFATEQFTGDGSRKLFTVTALPLSGSLTASLNGQVQEEGLLADYTVIGPNVTFATSSAPQSGDRISFRYSFATGLGTLDVAYALDTASGNGSQSTFNLSFTPLAGSLMVAVNGQILEPGDLADYTMVGGNSVKFNGAALPASGVRISFRYGYSSTGNPGGLIVMSQLPAAIPNGLATLGSDGKVPASQLPAGQGGGGGGGTQTFTTPSTTTWTVPSGTSRVFVQVWASGGGGAGAYYASGVGGGGGGYAEAWCPVTAGAIVSIVVGAGGAAGMGGTPPGIGGDSNFGTCAHALGGGEGLQKDNGYYPGKDAAMPGGYYLNGSTGSFYTYAFIRAGNPCNECLPSRNDQGGSGANYANVDFPGLPGSIGLYGGGGGGSGANANATPNQAGGAGGTSSRGGNAGNGGAIVYGTATGCTAGSAPGGGGGGGAWDGSNVGNGCAGARGQVTLWW